MTVYLFMSECARESEYVKLCCLVWSDSFIETTDAPFEQVAQAQMLYGQTAAALFAKAAALQHEVGEIDRRTVYA